MWWWIELQAISYQVLGYELHVWYISLRLNYHIVEAMPPGILDGLDTNAVCKC